MLALLAILEAGVFVSWALGHAGGGLLAAAMLAVALPGPCRVEGADPGGRPGPYGRASVSWPLAILLDIVLILCLAAPDRTGPPHLLLGLLLSPIPAAQALGFVRRAVRTRPAWGGTPALPAPARDGGAGAR